MSYVDEGPRTDEAVLMLHGNPTWSFFYRNVIRELAPSMRCIAPDHVGMGLSEKPQDYPYTLATRIADIEALVGMIGLKRVHLIVHDWGGAIGFGYAVRHSDMIGRIVVLNTAAFRSPHIPMRIALCRAPVLGPLIVRGFNGFAWPATWMAMHQRKLSHAEKEGYILPYRSWAARVAINAFVQDIPMGESHPSYAKLVEIEEGLSQLKSKPMRIVWGGADFCFNQLFLARWRELFPNAEIKHLPKAGHYILEDTASESVRLVSNEVKLALSANGRESRK